MQKTKKFGLFAWAEDARKWIILRVGTLNEMYHSKHNMERVDIQNNRYRIYKVSKLKWAKE